MLARRDKHIGWDRSKPFGVLALIHQKVSFELAKMPSR